MDASVVHNAVWHLTAYAAILFVHCPDSGKLSQGFGTTVTAMAHQDQTGPCPVEIKMCPLLIIPLPMHS
jgi:hypothetical protein